MARTRKHTRSRGFVGSSRRTSDREERQLVVHTAHHGAQLADKDAAVRYATDRFVAARTRGMGKRGVRVKTVLVISWVVGSSPPYWLSVATLVESISARPF